MKSAGMPANAGLGITVTGRLRKERAQRWFTDPNLIPISSAYDRRVTRLFAATSVEIGLAQLGREPRRVLEVGCGRGETLRFAARRLPSADLIGIDPSASAISFARVSIGQGTRIRVYHLAAEDLAGDTIASRLGQADLVLVHLTLGLWPDVIGGLRGCVDRLADGGLCYVADLLRPTDEQAAAPYMAAAENDDEVRYLRDQMAAWYSTREVLDIAEKVCLPDGEVIPDVSFSRFEDIAVGVLDAAKSSVGMHQKDARPGRGKQVYHLFFQRTR